MAELVIRTPAPSDLPALFAYLGELQASNGTHGTPLFDPRSRNTAARDPKREARFAAGLDASLGEEDWRRAWVAYAPSGAPAGHVDLRGHGIPNTTHRALLGLGVGSDYRRRGLATRLVEHALDWARRETEIAWIDLEHLGTNVAAARLYERLGFRTVATFEDMFRIDGASVSEVRMTLAIRS